MFDVDEWRLSEDRKARYSVRVTKVAPLRFISPEPGLLGLTGFARTRIASTKGGDPSYEFGGAIGRPHR